ncbi:MAG: 2OG-Fe(II) oxygenase [Gammaproteobacteria bacterium]
MSATLSQVPAPNAAPAALADCLAAHDPQALGEHFRRQDEFLALPGFLDAASLAPLLDALPALEPRVHRNFIPGHKKGGSVSRFDLDRYAPAYTALYASPELMAFFCTLTGAPLKRCPANDPHTYALYYYTEPGDHIGFHYDTSYYKGSRYTVLIGLVDESSCRLEYELYREHPTREPEQGAVNLSPGMLVIFNGDKLWHRVSPSGEGERRVALTLEFVTSHDMHPFRRFVSNMKDAIAYFGFRQVFRPQARR